MGLCLCSNTKLVDNENENKFKVINVNDDGKKICPGVMELTDTCLIFHLEKGGIVKWPYLSLRKYGFNSNLFSFVCGKRCQTGEGIFGFRCNRAEELFDKLQTSMQNKRITIISDTDCDSSMYDTHTLPYRYKNCPFFPGPSCLLPTSLKPEPVWRELPHHFEHTASQSCIPTIYKGNEMKRRSSRRLERKLLPCGITQTSTIHSYCEAQLEYSEPRTYQKPIFVFRNHMEQELVNLKSNCYDGVACRRSCIRQMDYENIRALHSERSKSIISIDSNSESQTTNCIAALYTAGIGYLPSSPSLLEKHRLELKYSMLPRNYSLLYSYPNRLSFGQDYDDNVATCFNFDIWPPSREFGKLNYIDVESSCDSDNPQMPLSPAPSVSGATDFQYKSYAELDLEKTAALSFIQQQRPNDDGTRKTRHNGKHFLV